MKIAAKNKHFANRVDESFQIYYAYGVKRITFSVHWKGKSIEPK